MQPKNSYFTSDNCLILPPFNLRIYTLADFNRAIHLDVKNGWYRYYRAQIAYLLHQEDAFACDMDEAIELTKSARASSSNEDENWVLDFNLALYQLFRMDYTEAWRLYDQLIATCPSLLSVRSVLEAVSDLLTVQRRNELAPHIQEQLCTRIAELEQSGASDK